MNGHKLHIPLAQRLWYYVLPNDETGCWEWTGSLNGEGYGRLSLYGKAKLAHRVSYETCCGDVGNLFVLHKCDNRRCVNPSHLMLGDAKANSDDMRAKGRDYHPPMRPDPTKCASGKHEWLPEFTYTTGRGNKKHACKACHAERRRARKGMTRRPNSRW